MLSTTDTLVIISCGLAAFYLYKSRRASEFPYPPGPKPWPIIGNLLQMPTTKEYETYAEWGRKYGLLTYLNILGSHIIIINTYKAARELLDGRSAIYSARPDSSDKPEEAWILTMMSGEPHKIRKAIVQKYFSGAAARKHQTNQEKEGHHLLHNLLTTPKNFMSHLKCHAANIVMLGTYGLRLPNSDDPLLKDIDTAMERTSRSDTIMSHLVRFFPFLMKYPKEWPGSGFRIDQELTTKYVEIMRCEPFRRAKQGISTGTAQPSFVSASLEDIPLDAEAKDILEQETLIQDCAGVMYGAGSESTAVSMGVFFWAMATHPKIQARAREEVDRVVGPERLPTFSDKESLSYVQAILYEILRFNCITPFGIPHSVTRDDIYHSFLIPEKATVLINQWLIFRDPDYFPDPEEFIPERFLGPDSKERRSVVDTAFGFGRRICPGRQLAEASIFIAMACCLACFNVSPPKDASGNPVAIVPTFASGFVRRLEKFDCEISPRSEKAKQLIFNALAGEKL